MLLIIGVTGCAFVSSWLGVVPPLTENDFASRLAFQTSSKRDSAQHG